jgi:flagellar hook-associated protein FlgK
MSKVVMKSSNRMILVIALAVVVFSAACSKNANTGNSTNSTNSSTTNKTSTTSTSTGGDTASSPIAALRAYYEAAMKKDIPTAKKYLSAGTMRVMEEGAKKMGKSVDEAFNEGAQTTTAMPEFSNEKITGDTATVDIKAQGATVTMPMVKEDGVWKLAMDKLIEDMRNSMGGDTSTKKPGVADDDDDEEGNHNSGH